MPTLIPTKASGATAKTNAVISVEPGLVVTNEALAERMALEGANGAFVADLLSGMLAHERCGAHLYRSVAARTTNPDLRRAYEDFGAETTHHAEVLEDLIASLGGDPNYVSPLARSVEATDSKLLECTFLLAGGSTEPVQEMTMLDAVVLAETVDHANWQTLGRLVAALPTSRAAEAVAAAMAEVESQEVRHLSWAQETRACLTLLEAGVASSEGDDLGSRTKEELYAMAQERDIPGRSDMTKEELIDALQTD
jgi:rubrerythrin